LPAVQQLFAALARIEGERAGFDGIADDLSRARNRPRTAPSAVAAGEWHGRPRRSIRVVDVTYRYPEGAGAISGVSLEIPAGTLAGFVGPNGAGKSTLAELILGLLAPDSGHIEIDGVALHAGNRDAWLGAIAYVPQQIALLDATLAQNIAFGVAANEIDRARVHAAASRARLDRVIEALPQGLATVIGEGGVQLSGGQRQRVGLARALYRRASLLVVDEGTNALDAPTEAEVMTLLGALRGESTVIVIAHRISALAGCDVLFELDGGRLVGRTTFAELAASAGPRERAHR
jgi:HlyD family secretion protein